VQFESLNFVTKVAICEKNCEKILNIINTNPRQAQFKKSIFSKLSTHGNNEHCEKFHNI
jgi:hypothetical protein